MKLIGVVLGFVWFVVVPVAVAIGVTVGAVAAITFIAQNTFGADHAYSGYTGRAEAVVSHFESHNRGPAGVVAETRVDYVADGWRYSGVGLGGAGGLREGDTLTVAYHPDAPDRPVTLETIEPSSLPARVVSFGLFAALFLIVALATCGRVCGWVREAVQALWWQARL